MLGKLASPLMKVDFLLAKNLSTPLSTMVSASAIDGAIQRKMRGRGMVRAGTGITFVNSNEDRNAIIKIIRSLENSEVLKL